MDLKEFCEMLSRSRVEIWSLIETAITVASSEYGEELRRRRDKIVESLYTPGPQLCQNCNGSVHEDDRNDHQNRDNNINFDNKFNSNDDNINFDNKFNSNDDKSTDENFISKSPLTPESNNRNSNDGEEEVDVDPFAGLFDDEQTRILSIKDQLEDPQQSEDAVVDLLQNLAAMDITFHALKETDIGRHVNKFRKHPLTEVRRLVKQLVRKWKETVDEWVKVNQPQATSNLIADGNSPQQSLPKDQENGHYQVPEFGYSPNQHYGSLSVERNPTESETNRKPPQSAPRSEAPSRPPQSIPRSASAPTNRAPKESALDAERLNSARRRLQENYQEAQNAKRQRTVQVMDIHDIPRPKNSFFAKKKGGFQGRKHR